MAFKPGALRMVMESVKKSGRINAAKIGSWAYLVASMKYPKSVTVGMKDDDGKAIRGKDIDKGSDAEIES
ncbi:MAG: hypothetical protein M1827_004727 [Pycnora praestabilis]|nr:MAG: hypothetical protein M1827_004727 [Pycnora praestabilis]